MLFKINSHIVTVTVHACLYRDNVHVLDIFDMVLQQTFTKRLKFFKQNSIVKTFFEDQTRKIYGTKKSESEIAQKQTL